MKILTWNINGIRATKVSLKELFDKLDADVICFQETKVTRDQLEESSAIVDGYNAYFSFSKVRSGYSGVATFVKDSATPVKAEEGLTGATASDEDSQIGCYGDHSGFTTEELNALDQEGRAVITQHRILTSEGELAMLTVINVYCPRAELDNEVRLAYKLNFYRLLQLRAEALLSHSHVIIVGDVNTSHKRIDHCDPDDIREFERNPGRQWLSRFLTGDVCETARKSSANDEMQRNGGETSAKFVDTFRYFHPRQRNAFTCWRTTSGARATNYGTRIDYIFADRQLVTTAFTDCVIKPDVKGSDHCPVSATLDIACMPSAKCPGLCTKYMPGCAGRQQKLLTFFSKKPPAPCVKDNMVYECNDSDDGNSLQSSVENRASSQGTSHPNFAVKTSAINATTNADKICSVTIGMKRKATRNTECGRRVRQGNLMSFLRTHERLDLSYNQGVTNEADQDPTLGLYTDHTAELSNCQQSVANVLQKNCLCSVPSWKTLLSGPPAAPLCRGHKEACVLRTVKKDGPNKGRQFWVCARPEGHRTNRSARCEYFEWIPKKR